MSLLERGNTRLAPLDTVEPAGWKRTRISNSEVEYFTERDWKHESLFEWEPVYSSETVESLLSQYRKEARKEVLLEAEAAHDHEDVLAPVGNSAYGEAYQDGWIAGAAAYRDELRRMAESTMEGEK